MTKYEPNLSCLYLINCLAGGFIHHIKPLCAMEVNKNNLLGGQPSIFERPNPNNMFISETFEIICDLLQQKPEQGSFVTFSTFYVK